MYLPEKQNICPRKYVVPTHMFKVLEQRKQWDKQYDSEICYTELLYSFVYPNNSGTNI